MSRYVKKDNTDEVKISDRGMKGDQTAQLVSSANDTLSRQNDTKDLIPDTRTQAIKSQNSQPVTLVTQEAINALVNTDLDEGKGEATIAANVANVYTAYGYDGTPLIGEPIKEDRAEEGDGNLLSTELMIDLATIDEDVKDFAAVQRDAITFKQVIKVKPAVQVVISKHNFMGIKSLANDDSLLTQKVIFQFTDILLRAQAPMLLGPEAFKFEEYTVKYMGQTTQVPGVIGLFWNDIRLADGLKGLVQQIKSFTQKVYDRSNLSKKAKLRASSLIARWKASSFQQEIGAFMSQLHLAHDIPIYTNDVRNEFTGTFKARTGRIDPFIYSILIADDSDELFYDIKYGATEDKTVIFSKDKMKRLFTLINAATVGLVCIATGIPLKHYKKAYPFLSEFGTDTIPTLDGWLSMVKSIKNLLIEYFAKLAAYIQVRTILTNNGLFGDGKSLDVEAITYPTGNKPIASFMAGVKFSAASSTPFGIRLSVPFTLTEVHKYISNIFLGAFFNEHDPNNVNTLLHKPIIDIGHVIAGIGTWGGYYELDLTGVTVQGLTLPMFTAHEFVMNDDMLDGQFKNDNVAVSRYSVTQFFFTNLYPMCYYNQASTTTRGVVNSSYNYGFISIQVPTLTKGLSQYVSATLPGGSDQPSALPTVRVK